MNQVVGELEEKEAQAAPVLTPWRDCEITQDEFDAFLLGLKPMLNELDNG